LEEQKMQDNIIEEFSSLLPTMDNETYSLFEENLFQNGNRNPMEVMTELRKYIDTLEELYNQALRAS